MVWIGVRFSNCEHDHEVRATQTRIELHKPGQDQFICRPIFSASAPKPNIGWRISSADSQGRQITRDLQVSAYPLPSRKGSVTVASRRITLA